VDALAVSIGARHGALQAPRAPQGTILAFDLLETIHLKLPSTHLVLHGSASLPQALQDQFVAFGGELPKTWGVPLEELQRSIGLGVRKINVDADCRLAMAVAFRRVAAQDRAAADPRKFIRPAMDAMHKVCRERIEAFGAAGRASAIKVTPLGEMAARYRSGAQGAAA
jgi:fructose-bisphosphate aldolase class II